MADSILSTRKNKSDSPAALQCSLYNIWLTMIARCTNPELPAFKHYGNRGISVCRRWTESFDDFVSDIGPRPSFKHSIDRIDVNGNYEPSNCRWADRKQQNRNTRGNRIIEIDGRKNCIAAWSEETGVTVSRIRRGMQLCSYFGIPLTMKFINAMPVRITHPVAACNPRGMQKMLVSITDELREVLDGLAMASGMTISETIEMFLRRDKAVASIRTEWPCRSPRGRPKKTT